MDKKTLLIIGGLFSFVILFLAVYFLFFAKGPATDGEREIDEDLNVTFYPASPIEGETLDEEDLDYPVDPEFEGVKWGNSIGYYQLAPLNNNNLFLKYVDSDGLLTKYYGTSYSWQSDTTFVNYRLSDFNLTVSTQTGINRTVSVDAREDFMKKLVAELTPSGLKFNLVELESDPGFSSYQLGYILDNKKMYIDGAEEVKASFTFDDKTGNLLNYSLYAFQFRESGYARALEQKSVEELLQDSEVPKRIIRQHPIEGADGSFSYGGKPWEDGNLIETQPLDQNEMNIKSANLAYGFFTENSYLIEGLRLEAVGDKYNVDHLFIPLLNTENIELR